MLSVNLFNTSSPPRWQMPFFIWAAVELVHKLHTQFKADLQQFIISGAQGVVEPSPWAIGLIQLQGAKLQLQLFQTCAAACVWWRPFSSLSSAMT